MTEPRCTCTAAATARGWSTECQVPEHRLRDQYGTEPNPEAAAGLRQRPGDQPLPVTADPAAPGAHDAIIALMQQRKALGLARYGSTLQPHTGRDTARDLIDELADGIVYAQTLATELRDLEDALLALVTVWAMEPGGEKVAELRRAMTAAGELLTRRGVPF